MCVSEINKSFFFVYKITGTEARGDESRLRIVTHHAQIYIHEKKPDDTNDFPEWFFIAGVNNAVCLFPVK